MEIGQKTTEPATLARLIAFYLPQFQPTPENDEWWGKGFTEWTNVAKTKPAFKGHQQPRVPADLGFCDLRLPQVREAQADLARAHGIEGFCYWHYWFEGRRILDLVEKEVLRSGEPDFPFCLAWANHTWSRTWLGDDKQILVEQTYSDADTVRHAQCLAEFFADARYIRLKDRPLFPIYAPSYIPEAQRAIDIFRTEITRLGLPNPMILGCNGRAPHLDGRDLGCDSNIDMTPKFGMIDMKTGWSWRRCVRNLIRYGAWDGHRQIFDFETISNYMIDNVYPYPHYPSVSIGWDNSPRRGENSWIFANDTPEAVGRILTKMIAKTLAQPWEERLLFVNAWNEWGEGMYLEPDLRFGTALLEQVRHANSAS